MDPNLVFLALRALIRLSGAAQSAYAQHVRDRAIALPDVFNVQWDDLNVVLALFQGERFDHGWSMLSATYKTQVVLPENVTPLPRKRAA